MKQALRTLTRRDCVWGYCNCNLLSLRKPPLCVDVFVQIVYTCKSVRCLISNTVLNTARAVCQSPCLALRVGSESARREGSDLPTPRSLYLRPSITHRLICFEGDRLEKILYDPMRVVFQRRPPLSIKHSTRYTIAGKTINP